MLISIKFSFILWFMENIITAWSIANPWRTLEDSFGRLQESILSNSYDHARPNMDVELVCRNK